MVAAVFVKSTAVAVPILLAWLHQAHTGISRLSMASWPRAFPRFMQRFRAGAALCICSCVGIAGWFYGLLPFHFSFFRCPSQLLSVGLGRGLFCTTLSTGLADRL